MMISLLRGCKEFDSDSVNFNLDGNELWFSQTSLLVREISNGLII